jgi:hypothetical protein
MEGVDEKKKRARERERIGARGGQKGGQLDMSDWIFIFIALAQQHGRARITRKSSERRRKSLLVDLLFINGEIVFAETG